MGANNGIYVLAALLFWQAGCDRHPRSGPLKEPPAAPTSEDSIHVGPLSGKIDGQPFQVKSARYYVDSRPGFEKIDIQLFDVAGPTPCGPLASATPPSVWLRRVGPTKLAHSKTSTTVKDGGEWEVHYQIHVKGGWLGYGEANALLVLEAPDPDMKVFGILSACFRDHAGSCVAGEFTATWCHIGIDEPVRGTHAMERPPKKPLGATSPSASTSTSATTLVGTAPPKAVP